VRNHGADRFHADLLPGRQHPTVGERLELDAIADGVIDGVSLRGGRGTVTGVLFDVLIVACPLSRPRTTGPGASA
jgi:predicted ABC-type sugar transport system permease subunit